MSLYADVLASGKPKAGPVGYDPELEREKFEFEKRRWEIEMEERKAEAEERKRKEQAEAEERKRKEEAETEERKRREEREFEEKKLMFEEKKRKEEMEFEEKKRKAEMEFEERKRRETFEAEQLDLKRQELAHQIDRDKAEDERRDSSVAKGKLFGDAMRASAIRMGADPIDAISFFRNVEQLFHVYGVPSALQAILIRPFLNEKAKSILGKLSAEILGDYARLKAALLQEFKLSSNVYLERFNTCRKDADETYVAFASRLKGLLDYYLESRRVDNFEKLCELLICDRVKSVLPEGCLRYVLSIESSKDPSWLDLRALTEAVDRYAAAHSTGDKPQAFAVGQKTYSKPSGMFVTPSKSLPPKNSVSTVGAGKGNSYVGSTRRCFNCGSTEHLRSSCPGVKKPSSSGHAGVKRVGVEVAQNDQAAVSVVREKQTCGVVDNTSQSHTLSADASAVTPLQTMLITLLLFHALRILIRAHLCQF